MRHRSVARALALALIPLGSGCAGSYELTARNASDRTLLMEVRASDAAEARVLAGVTSGPGGTLRWAAKTTGRPVARFQRLEGDTPTGRPFVIQLHPGGITTVELSADAEQVYAANINLRTR